MAKTSGALLLLPVSSVLADWVGDTRPLMGTEVSVYLWSDDAANGRGGRRGIRRGDAYRPPHEHLQGRQRDLEINRLAATQAVVAGEELFSLIQRALDISVLTLGAFDITFDSVGQHYDFRSRQRPDAATVEAERDKIDYRYVRLDAATESVTFLKEGVRINLGGIAKGYVVERGVNILRHHGVEHAIVTAGGDSRLLGDRRGRPWMVGIRDPRVDGEVAISVPLADEAISTSGDYERFFDEDGVRYHHIIRPATGEPAGGIRSATVFGPDAVITDALSTSVFVMGVDRGLTLIATLPDYESIVIDADGRVYYSDGLQQPGPPDGE